MVFTVLPTTAFAMVSIPTPVLEDATFSNGTLTALLTVDDLLENDMFEMYLLSKSPLNNGMGSAPISGYYMAGIDSILASDSTKAVVNNGKVQLTDSLYYGSGSMPTSGTFYVGVSITRDNVEGEISNLKEIDLGGSSSTDEWTMMFNAGYHWEECKQGVSVGQVRNEAVHSFSGDPITLTVNNDGFDPSQEMTSLNTPVLTATDGKQYAFWGNGFVEKNGGTEPGTVTTNYYANSFTGTNFSDYSVTAQRCSSCGYLKFASNEIDGTGFSANLDKPLAQADDTVNLKVTSKEGYSVKEVTVKDGSGNNVNLTQSQQVQFREMASEPESTGSTLNFSFIQPASNVTISITAEAVDVTLSYDANGGLGNAPADQTVKYGESAEVANGNELFDNQNNLPFVYWNTEADGSGDTYYPGDTITLTADTTLYAQYGGIIAIEFLPEMVTIGAPFRLLNLADYFGDDFDSNVYGVPVALGADLSAVKSAIAAAAVAVPEDYPNIAATGWIYGAYGEDETTYSLPDVMPAKILIGAMPTFSLTGEFAVGDIISIPAIFGEEYTYVAYWWCDWDTEDEYGISIIRPGDYKLGYSQYYEEEYGDPECYEFTLTRTDDDNGYALRAVAVPAEEGDGDGDDEPDDWLYLQSGGNRNDPWGIRCVSGTGTMEAPYLFTAIQNFLITYDGNGNTSGAAPEDTLHKEDTATTVLGQNTLAKSGYTFDGWNTEADGSGTAYRVGARIAMNANITLYAQWKSSSDEPDSNSGIIYRPVSAPDSTDSVPVAGPSGSGSTKTDTDTAKTEDDKDTDTARDADNEDEADTNIPPEEEDSSVPSDEEPDDAADGEDPVSEVIVDETQTADVAGEAGTANTDGNPNTGAAANAGAAAAAVAAIGVGAFALINKKNRK